MKKYYVEFENTEDGYSYCVQSKWFEKREDAIDWYKNNFDFVRKDIMIVSLMSAVFDEDDCYGDIICEEDIT